ncbi:MAG: hypothetical protein HY040_13955 [Planctomycetes bacterium]|nr:hypothetical protein [Planctomycetota bacterium]
MLPSIVPIGPEFRVNTFVAGEQRTGEQVSSVMYGPKSAAMDAAGNFVVVWSSDQQDGNGWGVYGQRFDASGTPLGTEFRVNTTTSGDQERPTVAMASNGDFVVAWSSLGQDSADTWGVYAQRYNAAGVAQGTEFLVNTTTPGDQDDAALAMNAGGAFAIAWSSAAQDGDGLGIYAQRFDAGGVRQGGEFRVNSTTAHDQYDPSLALAANGSFVVTWSSDRLAVAAPGLFAQRFDAAGVAQGPEFQVNGTTLPLQEHSAVATNPVTGDFVVTWSSWMQDGNQDGVFARRFTPAGVPQGAEFQVNTFTAYSQSLPDIAADASGNFVITWMSRNQDGNQNGVYAQAFAAGGTLVGVETRINTTTNGNQQYASLAMNGAGQCVVVWSGNGPGDGQGVFAQRLGSASITVTPTSGLATTESGGTASFSVVLASQPAADVTIGVSSSNLSEGTVSTGALTFTPLNWNVTQTVVITGVDDLVADGNVSYIIVLDPAVSADSAYNGFDPSDVSVTNADNEAPGISITPTAGLTTTEAGGVASFTIVLTSMPTADVTINLTSSNPAEGTPSASTILFTTANWYVAQTIVITGQDDFVDDGDVAYQIVTAPAVSADAGYSGLDAADVAVTNLDDDTAGIIVSPTVGQTTTEAGGNASFVIVLTSQPTAGVTISLSSSNPAEGTLSAAAVLFNTANWNVAQSIVVTGQNEFVDDGDVSYMIVTAPAVSADAGYNGLDAADVDVTNLDDDTAGIIVSPTTGLTTEAGDVARFTVVLTSEPIGMVTIAVASSNLQAGIVSVDHLTFTPANWNVPQEVMVADAGDPGTPGGNLMYSIVFGPGASSDASYNSMTIPCVALLHVGRGQSPQSPQSRQSQITAVLVQASGKPTLAAQIADTVTVQAAAPEEQLHVQIELLREVEPTGGGISETPVVQESPSAVELLPMPAAIAEMSPPQEAPQQAPPPRTLPAEVPVPPVVTVVSPPTVRPSAMLQAEAIWTAFDEQSGELAPDPFWQSVDAAVAAGAVATAGYLVLTSRLSFWLLAALMSRPLWRQFDPLEVIFAWEGEKARLQRTGSDEDDASLQSLVE